MVPYIIVLVISILLSSIAEKSFKNKKKFSGIFSLILLILILSLFAGLRTTDLGYDTSKYIMRTYRLLESGKNLSYLLDNYVVMEKGYLVYMSLLYNIWNNINFILTMLNLPVNVFFVIFMNHHRKKTSMIMMIIIYYCTLYALSFNVVRQSISMSIFLLILVLLDKKKYFLSFFFFIIGFLFHESMLFAIFALIIIFISNNNKISQKSKTFIFCASTLASIFFLIFYENIISFSYSFGIIGKRYMNYLEFGKHRTYINIEYSLLFLKSSIVIILVLYGRLKNISQEIKNENRKWNTMLIIDLIITFLSFRLKNTDRITWYLYYPAVFLLAPQLGNVFRKNATKHIGDIIVASVFILYLAEKLLLNQYGICPYRWVL